MIYVALLRGINVGGNNKVDMKELAAAFTSAGMEKVKTYINSGNIIFENSTLTKGEINRLLEELIFKTFGLSIKVLLKSYQEYELVMKALPETWRNDKEFKSDVLFLWEEVDSEEVVNELPLKEWDTLHYISGALLWHIEKKNQSRSGLVKLPGKALYKKMTIRNVNTTRKIWEIMQQM